MRRSFDNFAIVDSGLANNRDRNEFFNLVSTGMTTSSGTPVNIPYASPSGSTTASSTSTPPPYLSGMVTTPTTTFNPLAGTGIPYSMTTPTYTSGQQTSSGGFLSDFTAQELNQLGQTVGALTATLLQIRQQSQLARTEEERQALQAQELELERQRIEAMNKLADAQRNAGVPVTAGQGLSTGAIVGIVAGGVLVLGLIMFLAFRQK